MCVYVCVCVCVCVCVEGKVLEKDSSVFDNKTIQCVLHHLK